MSEGSLWPMLAQESLKALGGLGLLSLGAKYILRRVFEVCIEYIFNKGILSKKIICAQTHFLYILVLNCWLNSGCCRYKELRGFCCSLLADCCWDFTSHTEFGLQ